MINTAEATCDLALKAKNQLVPTTQRWAGLHTVNIRMTVPLFAKSFYVTILAGPERRSSERLRKERAKHPLATKANAVFLFSLGFILGGCCWIGIQTLAARFLQFIAN